MEVLGRDAMREGYRIRVRGAVALLPDAVISTGMTLTGGHGHATAYDWMARHGRRSRQWSWRPRPPAPECKGRDMPTEILMPALSPTMEEGTLAKWLVKEGDSVASGDLLAEIETDKATMEFEAVDEGTIGKILIEAGSEGVKVNTPIAVILGDGESADDMDTDAATPAAPETTAPEASTKAEGEGSGKGTPAAKASD